MGYIETPIQQRLREELGKKEHVRAFRNNVGVGWTYDKKRIIKFGLCKGSSDLIGIRSTIITPDMVGSTIGQFLAVEVKGPRGPRSTEQKTFLEVIDDLGGLSIVARNIEDISEV